MCNVTHPCLITCGSSPSSELSSPFRILLLPGEGGIQTFGGGAERRQGCQGLAGEGRSIRKLVGRTVAGDSHQQERDSARAEVERVQGVAARQKGEATREKMALEKEINGLLAERDDLKARTQVAETNEAGRKCGAKHDVESAPARSVRPTS